MVIWTGYGWIGFVYIVGCLIGGIQVVDRLYGEGTFESHVWPKLAAFLVCAALSWITGRPLNKDLPPKVFDPPRKIRDAGGAVVGNTETRGHTLAFCRLEYAGIVAAPLYLFIALEEAGFF